MSASSDMTERTLREIYLPAFETAVKKSQPWTVMCSYNRVNDVFASENRMLLTDILRTEWNFKGFVMSDWGAVADRVKGVAAGLDLEMPGSGGVNDAKIVAAVKAGTLSEAALNKAVIRILNIVFRAADEAAAPAPELDLKGDHTIAAELAKECAVLLQNRGVLPLKKGSKVVYIGGFAKTPRYQGGGSSHINTIRVDSALEMAESHGRRVSYVEGFPADLDQREEEEFLRAVSAAAEADAAVIFAGLPESFESEGFDRSHMRLPESQNNLIARVAAVQKNTVVVLHTGSPVECPWANDVNAVLCMYLGGEGVGAAADALLWGDANPSGRLPETWPLRLEDTPCYLDFPGDGRHVEYGRLPRGRIRGLPLVRCPQNAGAVAVWARAFLHRVCVPQCPADGGRVCRGRQRAGTGEREECWHDARQGSCAAVCSRLHRHHRPPAQGAAQIREGQTGTWRGKAGRVHPDRAGFELL